MNANIIRSRVPCLAVTGLILLSTFAGQLRAQPVEKTQTSTGQVVEQKGISELPSTTPGAVITETATTPGQPKTSQDLGMNLEWQPDFAGIKHPITLPLGGYAFKLGFDYTYGERTRNDVKFTSDRYVPNLEAQIGLPHSLQFDVSVPWNYSTMTRKDSTGEDSTTHNRIGNLGFGLQQNVVGNNGGTWGFSYMINGLVGLDNNRGSDFFQVSTQSDNNNNDNTVRRDRNNNNYGLGVSGQFSANLCCGLQATINSGVMGIHSYCGCYYCFDNRISLAKTLGERFALQASYDTSITTSRDSNFVSGVQAGIIWKPTSWGQFYLGGKDRVTGGRGGDQYGAVLEFSVNR
jgi:hypothetical protein